MAGLRGACCVWLVGDERLSCKNTHPHNRSASATGRQTATLLAPRTTPTGLREGGLDLYSEEGSEPQLSRHDGSAYVYYRCMRIADVWAWP